MTRKDYVLIAKVLSDTKTDLLSNYGLDAQQVKDVENTLTHLSIALAQALAQENSRFDYTRFLVKANSSQQDKEAILAQLG